jgi:hypothetical protein
MWRYVAASMYVHVLVRSSVCWVIHAYIGWEEVYLPLPSLTLNDNASLPSYHCYLLSHSIGYGPRDSRNRIISQKAILLVSCSSPGESGEEVTISERIKSAVVYSILAQKSYTGKDKARCCCLLSIIRKLVGRLLGGHRNFHLFYIFDTTSPVVLINIPPTIPLREQNHPTLPRSNSQDSTKHHSPLPSSTELNVSTKRTGDYTS